MACEGSNANYGVGDNFLKGPLPTIIIFMVVVGNANWWLTAPSTSQRPYAKRSFSVWKHRYQPSVQHQQLKRRNWWRKRWIPRTFEFLGEKQSRLIHQNEAHLRISTKSRIFHTKTTGPWDDISLYACPWHVSVLRKSITGRNQLMTHNGPITQVDRFKQKMYTSITWNDR